MSYEDLDRFRQLVLNDSSLLERLRETPDTNAFFDLIVRLGAERGYHFTGGDVEAALLDSRRTWIRRGM
jgi:predicted ribosomally synthesized peptide with nif11-like leader